MSTQDSAALQTAATTEEQKRTIRALTECMTTLQIAPGFYTVIGQNSGPEYTVDTHDGRCTCPDTQYNLEDNQACKHELRVRYATQELEIPDWVPENDVDPLLGEHVHTTATDGGHTTTPNAIHAPDEKEDALEIVDTGAGYLVYQTLTEERDGATVTIAKQLLGYYHVTDWDTIKDAVQARGHPSGDVHLPEFETIAEARDAAREGGA